jgi:hypothetical protein
MVKKILLHPLSRITHQGGGGSDKRGMQEVSGGVKRVLSPTEKKARKNQKKFCR